jgi:large subunit ribosomal protein L21
MSYAIISLGGKQYTVREGERLLVDRLPEADGATFTPTVLLAGGDGEAKLSPTDVTVTAKVLGPVLGEKIRIGKYRAKKGYKRHTGFRAKLTQIQIESIGGGGKRAAAPAKQAEPAKAAKPKPATAKAEPAPKAEQAAAPEHVKGMPSGYEELTIAEIKKESGSWNRPMLEAALEYERANAARKGAIAALESALAAKEES